MEQRHRVFLGLGSNLGDRWAQLRTAVASLPDIVKVSPVYETEALGGPDGQQPHLNCVVELGTDLSARALLRIAQECETAANRVRTLPNGPRTLDIDLLLIEGESIDEPDLVVPHPRMHDRRFVLAPLADLAPEFLDEGWDDRAVGAVWRVPEPL